MTSLKVLIAHTYYISRGGEDLVFETESKLLRKEGIDVVTVTFHNSFLTIFNFIFYPFNIISFIRMLRALFKHKPDLVHIHNWHFAASPSIIVACKIAGVPLVQTLHNHRLISYFDVKINVKGTLSSVFSIIKHKNIEFNFLKAFLLFQASWLNFCSILYKVSGIWKLVDRYIVLTENSFKLYQKSHLSPVSNKIVVKSNFVDGNKIQQHPKKDYFLYVGRLTHEKGLPILLTAFENSKLKLRIIGDGPLKKELEQFIIQNPNVEYLGFKDFDYIKIAMAESIATIFPSITLEGMPMTIIESFACGTPVIASKYSAMESMITHGVNGLHFEVGNIEQLKLRIFEMFTMNKHELHALSVNARKSYEEIYSPENNVRKLITIYSNLLNEKSFAVKINQIIL